MTTNVYNSLNVSSLDFKNASDFHDVCPKCHEVSDDYKFKVINNKEYFMCPKCGYIND